MIKYDNNHLGIMQKIKIMIIKPPHSIYNIDADRDTIFLAGSIEMWVAELWQDHVSQILWSKYNIYNPRRENRDNSWKQSYDDPNFYEQVNRELDALAKSDIIIMYFDPNTKSPISLLELWLYANSGKIYICCPDGFWRKWNIQAVADRYNIPIYDNLDQMINHIKVL